MELGKVTDLKHMARCCDDLLNDNLSLKKFVKLIHVNRVGISHFAGSNSLPTAVKANMNANFNILPHICQGFLYGLPHSIRAFR